MAGEDMIMARQGELKRLHVIQKVLERVVKQVEAAEMLFLSPRQIRRIVKRIKIEGDRGIIHKSRGKPSNRRIPGKIRDRVIRLYRTQYQDFGPTLATEKLLERDEVGISDETLRRWLIETGDWKKTRKHRGHRRWRERKPHYGEMLQMDGSHHDWFEGRGPWCVLMGYIDDATGKVFARFYDYEGTIPAMDSFKRYSKKYGLPMKVYLDKHTTYKSTAKPTIQDELNNVEPLSQFERALKELGVEVIHANSPQAKGRIERLFRTFQDRVVKEMRLRGIRTLEEANQFLEEYLPLYNKRFSVCPKEKDNFHRPLPKGLALDTILCVKTERSLRNDFTVAHNKKLYQIEDTVRAAKVVVQERIDGSMRMIYRDQSLRFKEIIERPVREEKALVMMRRRKPVRPSPNHPWRKSFKFGSHRYERRKAMLKPENTEQCVMQSEAQS
jgi:transposase-like protein